MLLKTKFHIFGEIIQNKSKVLMTVMPFFDSEEGEMNNVHVRILYLFDRDKFSDQILNVTKNCYGNNFKTITSF